MSSPTKSSLFSPGVATRSNKDGDKSLSHLVPVVTGSILCGAMSALSLMAVPVMLKTTSEPAQLYKQWVVMYGYGHQVLPGLAIVTAALYARIASVQRMKNRPWLRFTLAGLATVSIIPFTLICMMSTNDTLFALEKDSRAGNVRLSIGEAKAIVSWWSWLHLIRSMMPLVGVVCGVMANARNSRG